MSDVELLKSGQLVRYFETHSRWYFALVRRVRGQEIELSLFDKSASLRVTRTQVTGLEFLENRTRVFSRTRTQLAKFFYGREFERLRDHRLHEMKQALRKAGVSFQPKEWLTGSTRIQLQRDGSFIDQRSNHADRALAQLLPQWLEPFVLPSGSRDPLGLQAPAEKLVNEILPGLTVFTFRAGYYGFLVWAIRTVNQLGRDALPRRLPRHEVLNKFERALALCEFVYHGTQDDSCTLIGQRSKRRVLGSNEGNRYHVPESILKNQNSAGSFRLFATSLVSLGFVTESDESAAEGLLPFKLTSLGDELATAFQGQVDSSFIAFAMGEHRQTRERLRDWGKAFCFTSIARRAGFRRKILQGLLFHNNREAEKRYRTIGLLFVHGLLESDGGRSITSDNLNEDDASLEEDAEGAHIANLDVVLHFYRCAPQHDLCQLQCLAVFELLSLGLSAIFRAAVLSIVEAGKADIGALIRSIVSAGALSALWKIPMQDTKPKTVRKLTTDLLACEDEVEAASIGGALLVRIFRDPLWPAVRDQLVELLGEPVDLVDRCIYKRMDRSLADILPELLVAMVERHELVSERKNRQRWLFVAGSTLVRDDPQNMGLGLHALRFPQLGSLKRDLDLREEDLRNG